MKTTTVLLYAALIGLIGVVIPMERPCTTITALIVVAGSNLYLQWQGIRLHSLFFGLIMLGVIEHNMLPVASNSFLHGFDLLCAESFGSSPGLIEKGVVLTVLAFGLTALNVLTNAKSNCMSWIWLPMTTVLLFVTYGHVRNVEDHDKVKSMITYATESGRSMKIIENVGDPVGLSPLSSSPKVKTKTGITALRRYQSYRELVDAGMYEHLEQIKQFEDAALYSGKKKFSAINEDTLHKGTLQVGYCVTQSEIDEAIKYGFLPKGSKLPRRMTKQEADTWFVQVTIPTYLAQLNNTLDKKVMLRPKQTVGLLSFCHNLGISNLRLLIAQKGRLNDGNLKKTLEMIPKYNRASGKIIDGLIKRRAWEKSLVASTK